jgi:hypothetical protein
VLCHPNFTQRQRALDTLALSAPFTDLGGKAVASRHFPIGSGQKRERIKDGSDYRAGETAAFFTFVSHMFFFDQSGEEN